MATEEECQKKLLDAIDVQLMSQPTTSFAAILSVSQTVANYAYAYALLRGDKIPPSGPIRD